MNKEYIEKEYEQIIKEWKCAASEKERWSLREHMAKLDQIHEKYVGMIK